MTTRAQARSTAANILRTHFQTEAADAGLRSLDLASVGGGRSSASYDASAVGRAARSLSKSPEERHGAVRASLRTLAPAHVEILALAYGERLRTRDIEDGKKRRAVRQAERNWRVRLAELYGPEGLVVLASPLARRLHVGRKESLIEWLLDVGKTHVAKIAANAKERLDEALDAFCDVHGIEIATTRQRSSEPTRTRILALHREHGQEIGV